MFDIVKPMDIEKRSFEIITELRFHRFCGAVVFELRRTVIGKHCANAVAYKFRNCSKTLCAEIANDLARQISAELVAHLCLDIISAEGRSKYLCS